MVFRETFYFCSHQMTLYTHWTPCWQIISIVVTVTGRCWHLKGPDLTDAERPKYFGQFTRGLARRASLRHFNHSTSQCLYDQALHYHLTSCTALQESIPWLQVVHSICRSDVTATALPLPVPGSLSALSRSLHRSHLRPGHLACEDLIIIRIWAEETRRARFQNMHY